MLDTITSECTELAQSYSVQAVRIRGLFFNTKEVTERVTEHD